MQIYSSLYVSKKDTSVKGRWTTMLRMSVAGSPPTLVFFFFTRGCCGQWRISISDMKTDAYVFWILISHCVSVTAVLLFIGYSPSCRSRSCSRLTTGRKVVYALKEDFCRAHCSFHAHMEGKSKLYRSRMQIELLVLQTVYTNWTD